LEFRSRFLCYGCWVSSLWGPENLKLVQEDYECRLLNA
jgi:hypothetical protein